MKVNIPVPRGRMRLSSFYEGNIRLRNKNEWNTFSVSEKMCSISAFAIKNQNK